MRKHGTPSKAIITNKTRPAGSFFSSQTGGPPCRPGVLYYIFSLLRLLLRTPRLQLLRRPGPPYPPCLPCLLATHHPSPRLSETSTTWAIQHLPHLPSPTPPTQPWLPLSPMPATCPILATCLTEVHLTALMEAMAIPATVTFIPASAMATHPRVRLHVHETQLTQHKL